MTTENKRVAAYLPQPLYDLLETFKEESGLSESKAIISILAAHFGVAQGVSQKVAHQFVTVEQFNELQEKVTYLSELISELRKNRDDQQEFFESESSSDLKSEPEEISHPDQKTLFERAESPSESELSSELDCESLGPLAVADLAERFELKNPKSIDNKRSKLKKAPLEFLNWTRQKDKEGIGWEYHPQEKLYYPVL